MNAKKFSVESRGRGTVGELKGSTHQFYEDRYRLLSGEIDLVRNADRGEIFAVFDGVGSAPKGMRAAQAMADALIQFFTEPDNHDPTREGLGKLLFDANVTIHNWGLIPGSARPVGACAGTVAWVWDKKVILFHAGDTEAWSCTNGQTCCVASSPHEGEALVQYFGLGENLKLTIRETTLDADGRMLLFSDGLRKVVLQSVIETSVKGMEEPEMAIGNLMKIAEGNGFPDDVTALLITG